MEALSHAGRATVEILNGIDSHKSEGNEVKWGRGMMGGSSLLWTPRKTPISPVLPQKVRLLGFIGELSAHCPCVLCGQHLFWRLKTIIRI
jgi:hypothetical protein